MRKNTGAPSATPLRLQPLVELGEVGRAGEREPVAVVPIVLPARVVDGRAVEQLPAVGGEQQIARAGQRDNDEKR